jgi:pyocin large subunit-like protein
MKRDIHFQRHGHEFGAVDAGDYERMADAFLFGPMEQSTRECHRPNRGSRLRFDTWNRRFGSASVAPVFLKTFYRVQQATINYHGSEMQYFGWECGRINV